MAPKKKTGSQSSLVSHNFLPTLTKPQHVIGKFISLAGSEWQGCPNNDKDKVFCCVIRKFEAVHDFGAFKTAAFEAQEMGESGEGSLEPGVASGDVFWVVYPNPFLKHFYKANPDLLSDGHPAKPTAPSAALVPAAGAAAGAAAAVAAGAEAGDASPSAAHTPTPSGLPEVKQDAAIFDLFSLEYDQLIVKPGLQHGKRQQKWVCKINTAKGPCLAGRLLTFDKPNRGLGWGGLYGSRGESTHDFWYYHDYYGS